MEMEKKHKRRVCQTRQKLDKAEIIPHAHVMLSPKEKALGLNSRKETN